MSVADLWDPRPGAALIAQFRGEECAQMLDGIQVLMHAPLCRLFRKLRNPCDGDSLEYEALNAAHENRLSYTGNGSLGGWILAIAAQRLAAFGRRDTRDKCDPTPDADLDMRRARAVDPSLYDAKEQADAALVRAVWEVHSKLPPGQKRILDMIYSDGMSYSEAAAASGGKEATERASCRDGRGRMREMLGADPRFQALWDRVVALQAEISDYTDFEDQHSPE